MIKKILVGLDGTPFTDIVAPENWTKKRAELRYNQAH